MRSLIHGMDRSAECENLTQLCANPGAQGHGTGLQAHHLIEQRFAKTLGVKAADMASIALTKAEHQAFTNAWRALIPYGEGTARATKQTVMDAAREVYKEYPEILQSLGLKGK